MGRGASGGFAGEDAAGEEAGGAGAEGVAGTGAAAAGSAGVAAAAAGACFAAVVSEVAGLPYYWALKAAGALRCAGLEERGTPQKYD